MNKRAGALRSPAKNPRSLTELLEETAAAPVAAAAAMEIRTLLADAKILEFTDSLPGSRGGGLRGRGNQASILGQSIHIAIE